MLVNKDSLPVHIGIIMDGNGRWAKQRGLPRSLGHKEGMSAAKNIVSAASELGIKFITLYIFSTENWKRTQEETGYLMTLIKKHLRDEFYFYKQKGIRINHIGDINGLPQSVRSEIIKIKEETSEFRDMTLVLAINYGGRDEIIRGIKKIISTCEKNICEDNLASFFDEPQIPDADLIIRTGGEKRLSNFLLWHSAYAELIFTETLWPDYNKDEFYMNIAEFQSRARRFGTA